MFRRVRGGLELLLIHPGGPYWAKKDDGAWSIPKGLYQAAEDPLVAAMREFEEETGSAPQGAFIALGRFKLPSRKSIDVWAVELDFDLTGFKSNLFAMEWPPRLRAASSNFRRRIAQPGSNRMRRCGRSRKGSGP